MNKLFSTEPLASNSENHCVYLLNVIEFPNDPPILVHPLLHPSYNPPLQTYGKFITNLLRYVGWVFNALITHDHFPTDQASSLCTRTMSHQYVLCLPISFSSYSLLLGTVHARASCLTHQICVLKISTPPRLTAAWSSVERLIGVHDHNIQRSTPFSTLACPVGMILPMGHHSTNCIVVAASRP